MLRATAWMLALVLVAGPASAGTPPAPPARVVSLNPSLTAILVAIGARDRLVGVDDWSGRTQPEVAGLPRVGGLYSPSLEALVALEPDLVVLVPSAEQRDFHARLRALGIAVLALDPVGFDDVLDVIESLGRAVGRERAARERTAAIRDTRARVRRWAAERPPVRAVLVLQRDPTFVVGPGSFVDEMLRDAGGVNVASGFGSTYPRVAREWLIAARPEVLLDSTNDAQPAADYWARWPSIPAVSRGRVVRIPEGAATLPGPYLDRALRLLARSLHGPDAAASLDRALASARP